MDPVGSLRFKLKDSSKDIYGRRKAISTTIGRKKSLSKISKVKSESFQSEFSYDST